MVPGYRSRVAFAVSGGQPRKSQDLGTIDFPTSGRAAAQPLFVKGVLLMHSFEYDDAREAFLAAQKADPPLRWLFWGEAMTFNHPVWQRTSPDLAKAALAKLGPDAGCAAREGANRKGERLARRRRVTLRTRRETRPRPGLRRCDEAHGRQVSGRRRGEVVLRARAARHQPRRPRRRDLHARRRDRRAGVCEESATSGAAHYLIHAYDDPVHAPLGLRYADAYSKIAASASHALHMPSHIYVAMGMWDESASLNERSVKAADARRDAKQLDVDQRGFHALLWLVYSYAQQGRYEDARGVLAQMEAAAKESGSVRPAHTSRWPAQRG